MLQDPGFQDQLAAQLRIRYRQLLDRTVTYALYRWLAFVALLGAFVWRIYAGEGWYIVAYGLGIHILNMFIGFISPQVDPETDGPVLPMKGGEEFRPFVRALPEFKFWEQATRAVVVALCLTVTRAFDIPVFLPILVIYFLVLFALTMRQRIAHMIKHRYLPFSFGKQKYSGKGGKKGSGGASVPATPPAAAAAAAAAAAPDAMFRGTATSTVAGPPMHGLHLAR